MASIRSVAAAFSITMASVTAPVEADAIGGVFVTDPVWNAAATDAIGEPATVFRLFIAFDDGPRDRVSIIGSPTTFITSHGTMFYSEFGDRRPPLPALFPLAPELEWDTYIALGNLHQPSLVTTYAMIAFMENGIDLGPAPFGAAWISAWSITVGECASFPHGSADLNGALVIPEYLDPTYEYVFAGQYTVLNYDGGVEASGGDVACGRMLNDVFVGEITMGTYTPSGQGPLIDTFFLTTCTHDLSGDQVVDGIDLSMLLADWGGNGCLGDLNRDGATDAADLADLLAGWGGCD